jgi:phospholipid/cholesterol/gamma-HCH transport system substrate-binding protein
MEKTANYFFVGIFVSLAMLALVGFTIWLMASGDFGPKQRYTVYFTDTVSGLVNEAAVKYQGVDVGRIVGIRLAPERNDLVKVDIEVREGTPIHAGTSATIELQGITGSSYVELNTPIDDQEPPRRVAGEPYPILEGKGSELRAFLDELPELGMKLQSALGSVEQFAQEGAKMAGSIDEFSKEGTRTAGSIRSLADNLKGQIGSLKGDLGKALASIDDFSKEGAKTAESIRGLSDNLKGEVGTIKSDLGNTLSSIEQFSKEGAKTADAIRGLADKLKDDPSQILRGAPSQRGVVIPK